MLINEFFKLTLSFQVFSLKNYLKKSSACVNFNSYYPNFLNLTIETIQKIIDNAYLTLTVRIKRHVAKFFPSLKKEIFSTRFSRQSKLEMKKQTIFFLRVRRKKKKTQKYHKTFLP